MLEHTTSPRPNGKISARRLTHRIAAALSAAALMLLPLTPAYAAGATPGPLPGIAVTAPASEQPGPATEPTPSTLPPSSYPAAALPAPGPPPPPGPLPGPPVDSQPPGVSAYLPAHDVITILVIIVAFVLSLRYGPAVAQSTVQGVLRLVRRTPPAP
ncbi:hypothetical protein [Streptomyces sp. NPDC089919]|uniref:hypothetical protein n=1 Tax=Streptomyces sp. NPDC089919 TaxID=3155188 RepID=UPI00344705F9